MFQRNNFIRFHLLHYVPSGFFHRHLICHPLKYRTSKQSQVTGYLKMLYLYSPPWRQSKAQPLIYCSFLSDETLVWVFKFISNVPGLQKSHKEHDKEAIQCNQSKQTLELWKRHFTNSLFQEFKSSLHTQDFHQVQQESCSHSGCSNDTLPAWTFLDIKLCSLI